MFDNWKRFVEENTPPQKQQGNDSTEKEVNNGQEKETDTQVLIQQ